MPRRPPDESERQPAEADPQGVQEHIVDVGAVDAGHGELR